MNFNFYIFDQTLQMSPTNKIPRDSSQNYIRFSFGFSKDWEKNFGENGIIIYLFNNKNKTSITLKKEEKYSFSLPEYWASLNNFNIMAVGINNFSVVPTNSVTFSFEKSGKAWKEELAPPEEPENQIYQQILQQIYNIQLKISHLSAKEIFYSGEINGILVDNVDEALTQLFLNQDKLVLPNYNSADNGKFLRVLNGLPQWQALTNVAEVGA